jgi:lysophospholipid acyltransferase
LVAFEPLVKATGASIDELKLITTFLLSYPLAALLKRIPDAKPWQKNVFILAVSLFYLIGLFDLWDGVRTILYAAAGTYAIAYYIDGSFMPWIAFVFLMGHMSINHLERQFRDTPSVVDITGAQMVMLMKLSAFCWNVHDGRLKQEGLSEHQRNRAIVQMPSILDYAGYILFFPSLMAGPAFDFREYQKWLETSMFDLPAGTDPAHAPPTRGKRRIPRSAKPAAWKAAWGLAWIFLFIKCSSWYNVDFVLGDSFMQHSFPRRVWYNYLFALTARLKYYGVWSLTEGACILSGLGYNGIDSKTGKVKWNRLENVNPYHLETAQNSRSYLENWNKNTNVWLRNYVYLRVTPKGKKPGFRASLATFATSAFWHGFYPGYYMTFILGALIQTVAKNFRRHVRPFFIAPDGKTPTAAKKYYDVFSFLITQVAFCFTVTPFVILGFADSIKAWARLHFYCLIGVAATMAFFASPAKKYLDNQIDKRNNSNISSTSSTSSTSTSSKPSQSDTDLLRQPSLGVPQNLGSDIDEALQEIRTEVEMRKRRGSVVRMPTGQELRSAVEDKVGKKL